MKLTPEITDAVKAHKEGRIEESRQILKQLLQRVPGTVEALLWLARVSPDNREALAAAELALALALGPDIEIAQRAVLAVQARANVDEDQRAQIDVFRLTGMTRTQARAVIWPFKGLNKPVGILLDEGTVLIKDLAYGAENAFDQRVRQAARTLWLHSMLEGLPDAQEPPAPMKVIQGSNYSLAQERFSFVWFGMLAALAVIVILAMVAGSVVTGYLLFVQSPLKSSAGLMNTASMLVCLVLLVGIYWGALGLAKHTENIKAGRAGEQKVRDLLRVSLPSPWVLVHNLEWRGKKGDVDLLLIGPGGVWVFEVKAYSTPTRNCDDRWQYKSRWGWRKMSKHPGEQARRNAQFVKDFLDDEARVRWAQPVVVWAGEDQLLSLENPRTPVWRLSELSDHIEELWNGSKLDDEQIQKCATRLEKTVEEYWAALEREIEGKGK
jgi:hypothetical protein